MAGESTRGGRVYHRAARPRKTASRTFGESADWSDHEGCEALYTNRISDLFRSLRPRQWVKNLLLLMAPFFAFFDRTVTEGTQAFAERLKADPVAVQEHLGMALVAFILLSAATYVGNDLWDAKRDAKNPLKQQRPIAARKVSLPAALSLMVVCLGGGLALAWGLCSTLGAWGFFWCALAYLLIQPVYTFGARKLRDLAPLLLAAGFVLRAVAGAMVVDVRISPWLLLCVFVAALFVALCKQRASHFVKGVAQPTAADARVLDLEIAITAAATFACYALYTLATETIALFGTARLVWTVPFVVFGVFRYLRLTYGNQQAGMPEFLLLRDPILVLDVLGWLVACGLILTFA